MNMTRIIVRAFLPIACVWAARQEAHILRRGIALSGPQLHLAAKVGIANPEKVRLLSVTVIPPTNRFFRAVGTKLGFVSSQTIGMTLQYGIYIQEDHWGHLQLIAHELTHVAQYERLGGFQGFLSRYLQECIDPGYPLGDLELEAKRAENFCC